MKITTQRPIYVYVNLGAMGSQLVICNKEVAKELLSSAQAVEISSQAARELIDGGKTCVTFPIGVAEVCE